MKKICLLLYTGLMLLAVQSFSQEFWEQIPLPGSGQGVFTLGMNDNGLLVMGTAAKVYYSSDNGDTWTESGNWPGYSPKCIAFNSSDHVFIGTFSNGMYRSTDGGQTFTAINTGLTYMNVWDVLVLDNDDILIGTPGGIFKSTDNGNQWALFGTGLPADEIEELAIAENGDLYAGTYQSGIYRSTNNGATWTSSNTGLPANAMVTAMAGIPNGDVYAGIFPEGMFRTTDNGNSWVPFNNGMPFSSKEELERGVSIVAICVIQAYIICLVYLYGAFIHQYYSDFEDDWVPLSGGLPDDPTTSALATGPVDEMFLGTYEQGLFRNAWTVRIPEPIVNPGDYDVSSFPNPFGKQTTIQFQIPETGHVSILIYNYTGQVINVLTDKIYSKGLHEITWKPDGLAPGLYYFKFQSGKYTATRKLIFTL